MIKDLGNFQAPEELGRWRTIALGIGGILSLVILGIAVISPENREQALRSWLLGFLFWGGIGIGSLGVLMLQYLTGGAWGIVVRRFVEAGSRTLPIILLLFIPLAVGITSLYEWTHLPITDPVMAHRGWYMTASGWIFRSVIYFVIWGVMVYLLNNWGGKQEQSTTYEESAEYLGKATAFSGPAMVIYALVVTFAVVDWVMTLDPHWFSTIWGLLFVVGWGLSCFCFVVAILSYLSDKAPMNRVLGKRHFHDIGKLMLALVMVWAYFNFSQYLIIWSGNLPEETGWYLTRTKDGWNIVGFVLLAFHFAFPFLILLTRDIKMRAKWLAILAIFILVMRNIDMFYLVSPNPRIATHGESLGLLASFSWMDIVAPIAVGGIWLWYYFGELMKRPLVPTKDPFFENAIEHGKGH